jgi:hypothetical protein
MVLFADGSVHLLSTTMSPRVFEALSTIAGGENQAEPLVQSPAN